MALFSIKRIFIHPLKPGRREGVSVRLWSPFCNYKFITPSHIFSLILFVKLTEWVLSPDSQIACFPSWVLSPDSQIAFFQSSALLLQVEPVHSRPRFFSGQALLIKYIKKLLIKSPKSNIFRTVTIHRPEHFLVHFRCFQMRSISDSPSTPPLISFCCSGWKFGSNQIFHFKFLCKWQNSFQMS